MWGFDKQQVITSGATSSSGNVVAESILAEGVLSEGVLSESVLVSPQDSIRVRI